MFTNTCRCRSVPIGLVLSLLLLFGGPRQLGRCFSVSELSRPASRSALRSQTIDSGGSGEHYTHHEEASRRTSVLYECFRHTSAVAFERSGIVSRYHEHCQQSSSKPFRILEIGCGAGLTTFDTARILPKAHIVGIDSDSSVIETAQERLRSDEHNLPTSQIEFCHMTAEAAPQHFANHTFDAVWIRFVVVHVPNPIALVKAGTQCLHSNGILLIEDCEANGEVASPPLIGNEIIHRAHIMSSLKLGADIRKGPHIGALLRQTRALTNIRCHAFVPLFGASVEPWVTHSLLGPSLPPKVQYQYGVQLLRMSMENLQDKFVEMGVCTASEVTLAMQSVDLIWDNDEQIFSIPGGKIFQWWAVKE